MTDGRLESLLFTDQPLTAQLRHTSRMWGAAQAFVELGLIALQIDMLPRNARQQQVDHGACHTLAAMRRVRPHVDEVGVADTVGQETGRAENRRSVVSDN